MSIENTVPFVSDPTVLAGLQYIDSQIIRRNDTRLKFILYSEFGLPALCACVREIEDFCEQNPSYGIDISSPEIKRCVGRLVRNDMVNTLGYVVASRGNRIPSAVKSKYFSTAACYRREGTPLEVTLRCGAGELLTLNQIFPENEMIGI